MSGLAKLGLGKTATALASFSEIARCVDRQPVIFDWYWRIPLERGLAISFAANGQLEEATAHADRMTRLANEAGDRTWRGLAWQTRAEVAIQAGDNDGAVRCVEKALEATAGFETPLAYWRILRTAAVAYAAVGDRNKANLYATVGGEAGRIGREPPQRFSIARHAGEANGIRL